MKKFLSLVLALVMTMSLVTVSAGAKDFTDSDAISSADYAEAIDVMSALEIIDGYDGGAFQPQGTLTRGAAAKIIACMMLGKTTAEALGTQAAPFKDVPVGSTFAGYIAYCAESGLIDGYADGTFRPSAQLTGFAFLKTLLTAMGYDSAIEGFTGPNWTVNVARRAIENGLTDGNDNFVGTQLATREEACLYAVNTIKATLVEYENKGTTITINGMEIVQGASTPKVVTSGVASQATSINSDVYTGTVSGASGTAYYTVEFGEKYMPKLSLRGTEDDFARFTHTWSYDGVKIGTYTDDADLEYTEKVASDTIYDALGLTSTVSAELYVDGVNVDVNGDYTNDTYATAGTDAVRFTVQNNNTTKTGDTGILTQVWKTGHWNNGVWVTDVRITQMHYYVGDVVGKTAATTNRDAYVTIVGRGLNADTLRSGNFTTEDFAIDDVVVYNYSQAVANPSKDAVQNVVVPETATGTLTSFTTGDSATVGGTKYDYSCTIANEAATSGVNTDVTVVLDPHGYAIDIDGKTDENYAAVLGVSDELDLRWEANLLLADGTYGIKTTTANYGNPGDAQVTVGDIVSYTIKSGEKYQLTKRADVDTENYVTITNGAYNFVAGADTVADYTANGKTVFLVKTEDANGEAMYAAYEGIKNVPTITGTNVDIAVYCKTAGHLATVVYVDATNCSVLNPSSDVIFLKGNNDGVSYTYEIGNYYLYEAIVNGELRTGDNKLMTSTNYVAKDQYALYDGVSYDANDVATLSDSNGVIKGTGVYKMANDVLGTYDVDYIGGNGARSDITALGVYAYYPVADDCKIAFVNEDGDLQTGYTISSVTRDTNDLIWFKLNASNEITYAFILKVDGGTDPEIEQYNLTIQGKSGFNYTVKKTDGTVAASGTAVGTSVTVVLAKGVYNVTVNYTGGATYSKSVTLSNSSETVVFPADATVSNLTITAPSTVTPVNPMVTVKDSSGAVVASGASLSTVALANGTYDVTFTADNYQAHTISATVTSPSGGTADFSTANYATVDFTTGNGLKSGMVVSLTNGSVTMTQTAGASDVKFAVVYDATATTTWNYTVSGTGIVTPITGTVSVDNTGSVTGDDPTITSYSYTLALVDTADASGTVKVTATAAGTTLTSSDSVNFVVKAKIDGEWVDLGSGSVAGNVAGSTGYTTSGTLPVGIPYQISVSATVTLANGTVIDVPAKTQVMTLS